MTISSIPQIINQRFESTQSTCGPKDAEFMHTEGMKDEKFDEILNQIN